MLNNVKVVLFSGEINWQEFICGSKHALSCSGIGKTFSASNLLILILTLALTLSGLHDISNMLTSSRTYSCGIALMSAIATRFVTDYMLSHLDYCNIFDSSTDILIYYS